MGLAFMDRNILPLFVDKVKADLHITDVQFSLLTGLAFTMFYALCGIPMGRLVDSKSRPKIVGVGAIIWAGATAMTGLGRTFTQVFLARMAVGLGESSVAPASQSMTTDMFLTGGKLARAMASVSIGVSIGTASALLLGGAIAKLIGDRTVHLPFYGGLHAWQVVFIILGIPGLILAPIMIFLVPDPPRRRVTLRSDGRRAGASYLALLRFIWAHKATVAFNMCGYAILAISTNAMQTWGPAHLIRNFHVREANLGLIMGLVQLVAAVTCQLVAGWWIDRRIAAGHPDGAMQLSRNAAALALLPMLAFPFAPSFALSLVLLLIAGPIASVGYATAAIAQTPLVPNQMRAQFSATFLVIANIMGNMISPVLVASVNTMVFHDPKKIGVSAAWSEGRRWSAPSSA